MKKLQKGFMFASIGFVCGVVLLLILAIFGVDVFDKDKSLLYILLTFATLAAASFFTLSSLTIHYRYRVLSYVCLGLIWICTIFALIIYFSKFTAPDAFNKITAIVGIATVLVVIMVSSNVKLGSNLKGLQGTTFAIVSAIDVCLTLMILGVKLLENDAFSKAFFSCCAIAFALLCTISIIGRKYKNENVDTKVSDTKLVSISALEYAMLKDKVASLEKENKELKERLGL